MCRFKRDGRSKAFPQTSQGSKVLSERGALVLGDTCRLTTKSTSVDIVESPETDFRSSVSPGELEPDDVMKDRLKRDIERSRGESSRMVSIVLL